MPATGSEGTPAIPPIRRRESGMWMVAGDMRSQPERFWASANRSGMTLPSRVLTRDRTRGEQALAPFRSACAGAHSCSRTPFAEVAMHDVAW